MRTAAKLAHTKTSKIIKKNVPIKAAMNRRSQQPTKVGTPGTGYLVYMYE